MLDDRERSAASDAVRRLVLCTGKVYYDLAQDTRRADAHHVALARIEMLYPFPAKAVGALLDRYPRLEEVVWVQEEPENFGARKWMVPQITALTGTSVRYISRPERSSPAEGYPAAHREEQLRIVTEALS